MQLNVKRLFPVFLIATLFAFLVGGFIFYIGKPDQSLVRQNDAYFYAAEARAHVTQVPITPPVFSTLFTAPANIYFSYTWLQSLLVPHNGDWYTSLERLRLFEVFVAGLLAFLVFLVAYDISGSILAASLGTIVAMEIPILFRIALDRPEGLIAIFFLLMVWALIRRKFLMVAILAFAFPLTYSVSIVLLAPAFIYSVSAFLHGGRKALASEIPLTLVAFLSTCVGILAHPAPINYFLNGTWLHLNVFFDVGGLVQAAEMSAPKLVLFEWCWILIFAFTSFLYMRFVYKKSFSALSFPAVFLTTLTFFLGFMYLHSLRFSNYFFPIFGLWVASTLGSGFIASRRASVAYKVGIVLVLFLAFLVGVRPQYQSMNNQPPLDYYKNTAEFLSKHPGVVVNRFDTYAPIIFFYPQAQLTSGRDNVFMAAYDRDLYNFYFKMGIFPPEVIMQGFKATYLLDDGRNARFTKYLGSSKCITATYIDPKYPQVKLYSAIPKCK